LASTRSTISRIPRIPDSIRPYGGVVDGHVCAPAFGLEVGELGGQDVDLALGSSITVGGRRT
jgi:hypothetical protein